jgi:hypothetical protein
MYSNPLISSSGNTEDHTPLGFPSIRPARSAKITMESEHVEYACYLPLESSPSSSHTDRSLCPRSLTRLSTRRQFGALRVNRWQQNKDLPRVRTSPIRTPPRSRTAPPSEIQNFYKDDFIELLRALRLG